MQTPLNLAISRLRSLASAPELSVPADEEQAWRDEVSMLDSRQFDDLMAPLLHDGRRRLLALPEWSRKFLFSRFFKEATDKPS
jgi:hypothetical protein